MRDLTIRGAGDLLGPQQAGFIDQVGLDLYLELLSNAIARKQGKEMPEKKPDKVSQVSLNGYIPEQFTENDGDKLSLYQEMKKIKTSKELISYESKIQDMFGKIPAQVQNLFEQKKLDLFVNQPGVESLTENGNYTVIRMTPEWTAKCDGVRLFEKMNSISNKIELRLKNRMIEINIPNKQKRMSNLMKVIEVIEEEIYENR